MAAQSKEARPESSSLPHGSAPAQTVPHPSRAAARAGAPIKHWNLKKHVAHHDISNLRWRLGTECCPNPKCRSLRFTSCFELLSDPIADRRRFNLKVEKCEACEGYEDDPPRLVEPPDELKLEQHSLVVNNELSIGKRGTTGTKGNTRTEKTKRIVVDADDVSPSTSLGRVVARFRTKKNAPPATSGDGEAHLPSDLPDPRAKRPRLEPNRRTPPGAEPDRRTEDAICKPPDAEACLPDDIPVAGQHRAVGTDSQSCDTTGSTRETLGDDGQEEGGQLRQVVVLDAAAEIHGSPYGRIVTSDEDRRFWQVSTLKNRLASVQYGDMKVPFSTVAGAFRALTKHHPVYQALEKRGEAQAYLEDRPTCAQAGMALAGTKKTIARASRDNQQTWLCLETSETGAKILASFSALHPVPEKLSTQSAIYVPEWAAHSLQVPIVEGAKTGELKSGVFIHGQNPMFGATMYAVLHWQGLSEWSFNSDDFTGPGDTMMTFYRRQIFASREVMLHNYALSGRDNNPYEKPCQTHLISSQTHSAHLRNKEKNTPTRAICVRLLAADIGGTHCRAAKSAGGEQDDIHSQERANARRHDTTEFTRQFCGRPRTIPEDV